MIAVQLEGDNSLCGKKSEHLQTKYGLRTFDWNTKRTLDSQHLSSLVNGHVLLSRNYGTRRVSLKYGTGKWGSYIIFPGAHNTEDISAAIQIWREIFTGRILISTK